MIDGLKLKVIKAAPAGWIIRIGEHSSYGKTIDEAIDAWLDNYGDLYGVEVKVSFDIVLPLADAE